MGAITIRGVDEEISKSLKDRAKQEGASVNTFVLKLIKEALGLEKRRTRTYHDLDHLAGGWSEKDYKAFQSNIANFEKIDEAAWK